MQEKDLRYAIERWGTPLYIFCVDELKRTVAQFRQVLPENTKLCFAVKANPFMINVMAKLVDRIEVCSMGEYRICRACNIPAEKLLISGVLKKEKDLREILDDCGGSCLYTAESTGQFELLRAWSEEHACMLRVFPRLSNGSQFGMDREELLKIIAGREAYPLIRLMGVHYFSGTQKKNVGKISKELDMLAALYGELNTDYDYSPAELEFGPGLWADYFGTGKRTPQEEREELGQVLRELPWQGTVVLEMGRALAAYCGTYLTGIADVKCNQGRRYGIVDGGLHQLSYDGQIRGMYVPQLQIIRKDAGEDVPAPAKEKTEWTICGSLCTTNDVLVQQLNTERLQVGDVLAFEKTGAYSVTEGMALFLSHELPTVVSYEEKEGWKVLREQEETWERNLPR